VAIIQSAFKIKIYKLAIFEFLPKSGPKWPKIREKWPKKPDFRQFFNCAKMEKIPF